MSTVITNGIAITRLNPKTGGGGGDVDIIDNLDSTRTDAALSAKQGKVLKGLVDQKMEKPTDEGTEGQVLTLDENDNPVWDDAPSGVTIATEITPSSTNDDAAGAKAVYDFVKPAKGTSIPAGGLLPNMLYNLGALTGNVTIALATPADSNICNHWFFTFETGATAPSVTWDPAITSWMGGSAPTINASKHYEISVLGGVGVAMEV